MAACNDVWNRKVKRGGRETWWKMQMFLHDVTLLRYYVFNLRDVVTDRPICMGVSVENGLTRDHDHTRSSDALIAGWDRGT